jgi:hypothetical protein
MDTDVPLTSMLLDFALLLIRAEAGDVAPSARLHF